MCLSTMNRLNDFKNSSEISLVKFERKFLKAVLIEKLNQLFYELFANKIIANDNSNIIGGYEMDSKITQLILQGIIETGEYTLEGIAYYTRIPYDVIYEAACGISNHFSSTLWSRIVDLFLEVRPDIGEVFIYRLTEMIKMEKNAISTLLKEV